MGHWYENSLYHKIDISSESHGQFGYLGQEFIETKILWVSYYRNRASSSELLKKMDPVLTLGYYWQQHGIRGKRRNSHLSMLNLGDN